MILSLIFVLYITYKVNFIHNKEKINDFPLIYVIILSFIIKYTNLLIKSYLFKSKQKITFTYEMEKTITTKCVFLNTTFYYCLKFKQ